jgi:putative membrane protein
MDTLTLIAGTVALRPYVFGFLLVYLLAAAADLGGRRALGFTGWAWAVAFLAELSSTRIGIPFGLYHYTGSTQGREFFLANVPVFDSISFTFLAYAAFALARRVLRRSGGLPVVLLSGVLMMLLDVVIDPLAVRGDRWFLGQIFYYPAGGAYFGVPLSNFLGWAIVGWVIVGGWIAMSGGSAGDRLGLGVGLYYGVLAFNLAMTAWIGEYLLLGAGLVLHGVAFGVLWSLRGVRLAPTLGIAASSAGYPRAINSGLTSGLSSPAARPEPLGSNYHSGLARRVACLAARPNPSRLNYSRGGFGRGAKPPSELRS